jgi:heterodisulfide reductase subunit A
MSGLAAVTQSAAVLKKGSTELDPLVAIVVPETCTAGGDCLPACPYDAISMAEEGDRHFAIISPTGCKGCGGCVPMCPENAIDLLGYTDAQITSMIESLVEVPV